MPDRREEADRTPGLPDGTGLQDAAPPAAGRPQPDAAHDNPYTALTEQIEQIDQQIGDPRWAFGSAFVDLLAGIDLAVPDGVAGADLAAYCLMLGDDALVLSHRLQEWITHAPELEEEAALANVALDLLGQARMLLRRAGSADGSGRDEDELAFTRSEREFRNARLVEEADPDFASLMVRLLAFSTIRLAVFDRLRGSRDPVLAAFAARGVPELTYHREYAADWVVRLGDGTPLSHRRVAEGVARVVPMLTELTTPHPVEQRLAVAGVAVDPHQVRDEVDVVLHGVLGAATIAVPPARPLPVRAGRSGRDGRHGEAFGYLLAELQSVARAHPGAVW